ncbi:MAG: DUF2840 domain-containing protein [Rudaea sp.]|uniref:DUF2840 domain-containing protein n=1 Tax=unclassified Rudaea TaxID=2627037 RepID=UPI0010F845A6|nr:MULTISPECIES: DUF2840 domain-containing protein [unclassified Rudaea]MBN8888444.1 DUF2840 domain-containing protein [Rudaea sp.]MBR0347521.1 DUF2840 domain-containing protein [Rudaea sp.]
MNDAEFSLANAEQTVCIGDGDSFTEVHLEYRSNRRYRLLFGAPFDVIDMDSPRPPGGRIAFFRPGDRFGLVLWELNDIGTTHWRVLVCRALCAGETGTRVPQVQPGAITLLDVEGATRARAALTWLRPFVESGEALALPEARFVEADFRLKNTPLVRLKAYTEVRP